MKTKIITVLLILSLALNFYQQSKINISYQIELDNNSYKITDPLNNKVIYQNYYTDSLGVAILKDNL